METGGVGWGGYHFVLVWRSATQVWVYTPDQKDCLQLFKGDPILQGLTDESVSQMRNHAGLNISDGACDFLTIVKMDGTLKQIVSYGEAPVDSREKSVIGSMLTIRTEIDR
jgi:hypothetical protein